MAVLNEPWYAAITRINAALLSATHAFFAARGIASVAVPVTTGTVTSPMGLGSDSAPVPVSLFGERQYLADSMQFHLELLLRHGLTGAHYVMPTFRGDEPDEMHLNQFFHSEAEITGGLDEVFALVDDYVRALAAALLEPGSVDDVTALVGSVAHVERLASLTAIPRVTYAEAERILPASSFASVAGAGRIIRREGERQLVDHFGGVVWLTHPDRLVVPFYQATAPDGTACSGDLLLGAGEVVGAGERHCDGPSVRAALAEHGVDAADYAWYVTMKENRPLRTAGFGLGLERFLLWALSHDDVRDMQIAPRLKGVRPCL